MPATRHAEAAPMGGMAMLTHDQKRDILITSQRKYWIYKDQSFFTTAHSPSGFFFIKPASSRASIDPQRSQTVMLARLLSAKSLLVDVIRSPHRGHISVFLWHSYHSKLILISSSDVTPWALSASGTKFSVEPLSYWTSILPASSTP